MPEIKDFFKKFEKIILNQTDINKKIQEVIIKHSGILVELQNINIKYGVLYLKIKPIKKNKILLRQDLILSELKNTLSKNKISKII